MGKGRSGNRTTVLLFVIAIAATLYAHFFESRREVWSGAAEAFANVEPADIVAFEIVHGLSADAAAAGASARCDAWVTPSGAQPGTSATHGNRSCSTCAYIAS